MNSRFPAVNQHAGLYTVMMMGRPASGKTTVADWLAKSLAIRHILVAKYKREALDVQYTTRDSLREDLRDFSCEKGIKAALESLKAGESVILDSSFHKLQRRRRIYRALSGACPLLVTIYCLSTDIDETRRRIQARKGRENEARHQASDFAIYEYLDRTFDGPQPDEGQGFQGHTTYFEVDTFHGSLPVYPADAESERFPILTDMRHSLQSMLAGAPSQA